MQTEVYNFRLLRGIWLNEEPKIYYNIIFMYDFQQITMKYNVTINNILMTLKDKMLLSKSSSNGKMGLLISSVFLILPKLKYVIFLIIFDAKNITYLLYLTFDL